VNLLAWISANIRTFLWAFAFAVAVWVAAVTSADPDEVRPLTNPIPIEIVGQNPRMVIYSEIPATVDVVLRAPRSAWAELEANPESARAILDLSGLAEGEHEVDLQIQIDPRPVRIVSVSPRMVALKLEPLSDRTLPVTARLLGELAIGYQAGEATIDPEQVVVSGAESVVEQVDEVWVSLSLDGLRETLDEERALQAVDADGQVVEAVTLTPANVRLTLPVSQQGGYRDMAVKVVVRGRVASGYRLTDISVFPPVITVFSSQPDVVSLLPAFMETQPLDLNNAEGDITTRLGLNLPPGISVVGEQTVLIQAGVAPIESSIPLADQVVTVLNLAPNLTAQVSPTTVDVIVSGPLALLSTLRTQDVRASVDVTGLGPGTYQVTPTVDVLISDVIVESVLPGTIQVVVTASGTPTPTPR
jgi:YbbR domain-containing protein